MKTQEEKNHAKEQAKAQLESIIEMVTALETENEEDREKALETIQNDPLSVEVRSNWHMVGGEEGNKPSEFKILLCWGGPACQIIGDLDDYQNPENPRLQCQDWGTSWTDYPLTSEEEDALLIYCQQFYFED
jgi:hypothetical protein